MTTIATGALEISSPAFDQDGFIHQQYTCQGDDINPEIKISNIPDGTKSLTLIVEDPDAPKGTFDHWIIWNIEPTELIPENSVTGTEGINGWGETGYKGPCPPSGTHHYHFKIFALDLKLELKQGASKQELESAMQGHVLAKGELIGLYKKFKEAL